jgi:hypothetical protein
MAEYIYNREIVGGAYNIHNHERLDGELEQINLAKEVEAALPGENFRLICIDTEAKFIFENELTVGQITTLTNTVEAHKNNT